MKRRLKRSIAVEPPSEPAADANVVLQVKVWLVGISPMVWRRVLVPATFMLRELHGVIQVAMGSAQRSGTARKASRPNRKGL